MTGLNLTLKNPEIKTDLSVAETILKQLGGNRFVVMTGAHNFSSDGTMLQFNIKAKNKAKVNAIVIHLDADDTYTVKFWDFKMPRLNRKTMEIDGGLKEVKNVKGIYAENLQDLFTNVTGLYTKL